MKLDKKTILEKTDYAYVYGKYINPSEWKHVKENWYRTNSPFREDKNPSFSFNTGHGAWKDFGDESGDIIKFIEIIERTDFKGALEILSNYAGIKNDFVASIKKDKSKLNDITAKQIAIFTKNLLDHVYPKISDIVFSRGITNEIIKKYKIGLNQYYSKNYGCYICEVIIPYKFDESGNVVNYKKIRYNNEGSKAVELEKDGVSTTVELQPITKGNAQIFPKDVCKSEVNELVLCEGEYDCLVLLSQSIQAVTGTAGAGTFTQLMADQLRGKDVTILYDNDEAGEKGTLTAYKRLEMVTESVRVASWKYFESVDAGKFKPKEKYDVSDYFGAKKEKAQFLKMLESAKSVEKEKAKPTTTDKEKLVEILYEEYEYRKEVCYRLIHENVVNHILTVKKVCSTRESNRTIFFEYKNGYWERKEKEDMVKYVALELLYHTTTHIELNQVVSLLGDMTYVSPDLFNARLDLVNLDNTAFNTVTMKPEPHKPEHYFTYKNSYKYDVNEKCPFFMKSVREYALEDQSWIDALGEIFGYCLTGDYPYQKMFWWYGSGRNGKGTLSRVLSKLVGEENTMPNLNPKTLDGAFDKVDLIGKKLAFNPDLEPRLPNATILKQLTGGDKIGTSRKYLSSVTFTNTAKILLLMNGMPDIPSNESLEPIFRRLYLLPFDFKIRPDAEDMDIEKKFEAELSGIFNWAIESLKRLNYNKNFTECVRGLRVLELYKGSANSYMQFFTDRVVFERTAEIWGHDLWDAYKEFMKEHHGSRWFMSPVSGLIVDKISFGKELKKQFSETYDFIEIEQKYHRQTKKNASKYKGLRLKGESDYDSYYDYDLEESDYEDPYTNVQEKAPF